MVKSVSHRSWKKYMAHREVKAGCSQRAAGPETHAFIRVQGRVLWGSQARAGLVSSNQTSEVLVRSAGVLSKGHVRHEGRGEWGGCCSPGLLGMSYQQLAFACGSVGCCLSACSHGVAVPV